MKLARYLERVGFEGARAASRPCAACTGTTSRRSRTRRSTSSSGGRSASSPHLREARRPRARRLVLRDVRALRLGHRGDRLPGDARRGRRRALAPRRVRRRQPPRTAGGPRPPVPRRHGLRRGARRAGTASSRPRSANASWCSAWRRCRTAGGASTTIPTADRRRSTSGPSPRRRPYFAEKCAWLQTNALSPFVQNAVCQRHFPDRLELLRGKVLRTVRAEGVAERTLCVGRRVRRRPAPRLRAGTARGRSLWPRIEARHAELALR